MSVLKKKGFWKWAAVGLVLIGLFITSRFLPFGEWAEQLSSSVKDKGAFGVVAFILAYVVGTIVFFPGSLLTIAAGVIFGLGWGIVVASISAVLGATCAFLIARYLARSAVEKRAKKNPKFQAIDEAIGEQGWKIVGLLRLSPVVPFNFANYFFGITRVDFWPYVLASWIGMLPGTILYVYLGAVGKATLGEGKSGHGPAQYIFLGVGMVATVAVTIYLTRLAKKKLKGKPAGEKLAG